MSDFPALSSPAKKLKNYLKNGEKSTLASFKSNIKNAGVQEIVVPLVKFSSEAFNEINALIDLIFIDGSHIYEDVLRDYNLFFPKLQLVSFYVS